MSQENDRKHNLEQLKKQLRETDQLYPFLPGLLYRSMYGFVAEHGVEYTIEPWSRFPYAQGAPLQCFANATYLAAANHLRYVEGFVIAPDLNVILHGWAADEAGRVIDSTWRNTGLLYLGVEFSLERSDDALWNGDACVLNDEHRNYPIFQRQWTGEDYSLRWPASDRLDALRRNDGSLPASILAYEASNQEGGTL